MLSNRRTILSGMLASLAAPASLPVLGQEPAKPTAPPRPLDAPFDVAVPVHPTTFTAEGKKHFVYEVHMTNFGRTECLLSRFVVLANGKPLTSYAGDDLMRILLRPGVQTKEPMKIGAGLRAVACLWITLEASAEVPTQITHLASLKVGDDPNEFALACASIPVRQDLVTISPPLRGDSWAALNGPANASGHRRALIPTGGGAHISQRFAIDWVQLREDGQTFTGDRLDNKNYRAYGNEALAVADGTVVAFKDGIPENVPPGRAVPITLETVGGNHVILDIGGGHFAFYAHLQPGKIRVKMGDRVKRGQVVGLVGNSGNSTEPHLHFHICDRNSPLASEGLPYVIASFETQGKGEMQVVGSALKVSVSGALSKRSLEMPLQNEVIRFS
jgi:murein DD-endopeptidase